MLFEKINGWKQFNLSILTEKTKTFPHGILGGENGSGGSMEIRPHRFVPSKGLTKFYPGEELILNLPGGGGYGLKEERDNKLIARDNELGYNN